MTALMVVVVKTTKVTVVLIKVRTKGILDMIMINTSVATAKKDM